MPNYPEPDDDPLPTGHIIFLCLVTIAILSVAYLAC